MPGTNGHELKAKINKRNAFMYGTMGAVVLTAGVRLGTANSHSDHQSRANKVDMSASAAPFPNAKPDDEPNVTVPHLPKFDVKSEKAHVAHASSLAEQIATYMTIASNRGDVRQVAEYGANPIVAFHTAKGANETVLLVANYQEAEVPLDQLDQASSFTAIVQDGDVAGLDPNRIKETVDVSVESSGTPVVNVQQYDHGKLLASYTSEDMLGSVTTGGTGYAQYDPGKALGQADRILTQIGAQANLLTD